jgi:hypothetical protein
MPEVASFIDEQGECLAGGASIDELADPDQVAGDTIGTQDTAGSLPSIAPNSARRCEGSYLNSRRDQDIPHGVADYQVSASSPSATGQQGKGIEHFAGQSALADYLPQAGPDSPDQVAPGPKLELPVAIA